METLPALTESVSRLRHCENCFMPADDDWRVGGQVIRIGKRRPSEFGRGADWLIIKACRNICFIATLLKKQEVERQVIDEWQCVALVLNRIFLYLFTAACFIGSFYFMLQAPSIRKWAFIGAW